MPAVFPDALPADSDLGVARDFIQTTLTAAVTAAATSFPVVSIVGIVVNQVLVVDSEAVLVSVVANPLTVVRGYGGTTAAIHNGGATLAGNVIAQHHNQLADEVKAIAAKVVELNNALGAISREAMALLGMVPDGLWTVLDDGLGGVEFLKNVRIDGRSLRAVPNTAPTDAEIPNGFSAAWYNEATEKLTFRIRRSNGVLVTKEVA